MNGMSPVGQSSVVVVGAGVMGLLTARYLRGRGLDVCLIESSQPGRAASWAGGGILSPLRPWLYPDAVWRLVERSLGLYPALAAALKREVGVDIELEPSGMLYLNEDLTAAAAWAEAKGQAYETLEGDALATAQDGLGDSRRAILFPDVHQLRNPRLLKALIASLPAAGVRLASNAPPTLHIRDGRAAFAVEDETPDFGRHYVVAAGAWTAQLLGVAGALPVSPIRGQMLCLKAQPTVLRRIVMKGDHYLIPRRDGRILVGSTLEDVGFDPATTQAARDELWAAAVDILPGLAAFPIEAHWAGLRPSSPTGVPFIGQHPHLENVWVCTGHFRNGLTMAPASVELLGSLMFRDTPVVDAAPYAVAAT